MNYQYKIFLTNICYDFFLNWQTEKKKLFWTNKKFDFLFQLLKLRKIWGIEFVNQIGEDIWWIRYNSRFATLPILSTKFFSVWVDEKENKFCYWSKTICFLSFRVQKEIIKNIFPKKMHIRNSRLVKPSDEFVTEYKG